MSALRRVACLVFILASSAACSDDGADSDVPFADGVWDLVWYSDSTGWEVAEQWASVIEDQFGVEVRVHDHAAGVLSAVEVLRSLGITPAGEPVGDDFGRLGDTRGEVADAEIVVVYGNPIDSGSTDDLEQCVTTSTAPRDPPTRYAPEDFAPYEDVLASIYAQVFDLVADRPVIVRAIDSYNPVIAPQQQAGVASECIEAWESWSAAVGRAAERYGVPLVSMYDAFNGPDHDEDPREKGYISGDGEHTTTEGQAVLADTLHRAGYEPVTSPTG